MSTFRSLVSSAPATPEELPLIHTSLSEKLDAIAASGHIELQNCPVFGKSLAYLFYGRPAYRSGRGTQYGESIALCPVCFVFKPRSVSKSIHSLHPCDTGATFEDRFAPEILRGDLPELALDPRIESARQAVGLLFDTNGQYFLGKVAPGKEFAADSLEDRFYRLLQKRGPVGFDDRKSAIEVTVNAPVALAEQLMFVVLPREFLAVPEIRDAIFNQWNCDPVPYDTFDGDKPESYYGVVRREISKRFQEATRI